MREVVTLNRTQARRLTSAGSIGPAAPLRVRGTTMIEVLIALLILSIGLLGLAGLQAASLKFNHSSYMRTHADNMANDIVDRMRANRKAARNGDYDIEFGADPAGDSIAAADLGGWLTALERTLPGAEGRITVDADDMATIRIRWDDTRGEDEGGGAVGDGALTRFEMTTRL